jgi:hypothetical protein
VHARSFRTSPKNPLRRERPAREAEHFLCRFAEDSLRGETLVDERCGAERAAFVRERPAREAEHFLCRFAEDSLRGETLVDERCGAERAAFV